MKPSPNFVKVKAKAINEELTLAGSIKIYFDSSFEKEKNAVTEGEVVDVPDTLFFERENGYSLEYDNKRVELRKGDKVIFHYLAIKNCLESGRYEKVNGEYFFYIRYDRIFLGIREQEIIPINGWLIVEPFFDVHKTTLALPDHLRRKQSTTSGIVKYAGTPLKAYLFDPDDSGADADNIKVGDRVTFKWVNSISLQYSLHETIGNYYRIHRKSILTVE